MRRVEVRDGDVAEEALFAPHRVEVLGRLHVTKRTAGRGRAERGKRGRVTEKRGESKQVHGEGNKTSLHYQNTPSHGGA